MMTRRNFFIHDDLYHELQELAKEQRVATSHILRVALTKYLAAVKRAKEDKKNG
jgi:predicted transcriptional regulator